MESLYKSKSWYGPKFFPPEDYSVGGIATDQGNSIWFFITESELIRRWNCFSFLGNIGQSFYWRLQYQKPLTLAVGWVSADREIKRK